jgi:hypothetical protein
MDSSFTEAPAIVFGLAPILIPPNERLATLRTTALYILMLSRWANDERVDANEQPLKFLLPLLELHVSRFQAAAAKQYRDFLQDRDSKGGTEGFQSSWRPLRDAVVDATLPIEAFKRYDVCHTSGIVQRCSKVQRLLKRFDHVSRRVSQFEQHMRDELQLQVGHSSLQESRESIKQSKIAIEESKRVKMRKLISLQQDE